MSKPKLRTKPLCPRCGSRQVRHRRSTDMFYCRRCGWEGEEVEWAEKVDGLDNNSDEGGA